ncbi:B12-binding domain-containing radical SAM protein [Terrimonas pollutisoli]|uniref:B12-binding domain-containing radical SAM protein n=1 Tax=Terrimonas pollutisoli TaxID=3034147 RepID=UPI0023EB1034|nr:radical SAM protein [Terrimonas sp. H1YJ31]
MRISGSTNILFSHSYFLRFDPKQWATGQPYAPIGSLYAAALMRQQGYNISFFDTMFAHGPGDILPSLANHQPAFLVLYDDGFNYLTKMCLTNMREAAFKMIKLAKENNCTVIISSSDSTDHYEQYLQEGADFILLGEAEQTLLELVSMINQQQTDFLSIAGLAYKEKEAVVKTAKRNVMKDLDSLPFPAWDLIDLEIYRKTWLRHKGYFSMNMATTRGCPFKCNWCAKPIYGNRYNSRSPRNVVTELKMLKEKFGFDHIWFCDDIFGLKPGWVHEFADLLEKEKLHFRFKIQARADLLVQENYVRDLARAGCENVWMGAESGSQKILDAMDKGTTVEQIYKATALLKKNNIHPSFFIQFGYPGETREDISKTIRMINELIPYEIGISVSYPLPGTVFYERVKKDLKEKTNWTDSDELALLFRNTYAPAFYKQLHRYVHKTYRKHLAIQQLRNLLTKPFMISYATVKKALSFFYYAPAAWLDKRRLDSLENMTA